MGKELLFTIGRPVSLTSMERIAFNESVQQEMDEMISKPFTYEDREIGTITRAFLNDENAMTIAVDCTDESVVEEIIKPQNISFSIKGVRE